MTLKMMSYTNVGEFGQVIDMVDGQYPLYKGFICQF